MERDSVIYENELGSQLRLSGDPPFVLAGLDGLYAPAEYDRETVKTGGVAGETVVSGSFAPRTLTLDFTVLGETRTRLRALCERIQSVFSPALSGILTLDTPLGGRCLRVWPDATPAFSLKTEGCATVSVSLTAYEPLFTEAAPRVTEMAAFAGGWQFPTALEEDWVFGERLGSRLVTVNNPGQTDCGFTAVLRAEGLVRDPFLLLVDRGARLTLERDLLAGDRVELSCLPHRRRAELIRAGERFGLMGQLRPDSEFSLLRPGDNLLLCGALVHPENLRVTVEYRPAFA